MTPEEFKDGIAAYPAPGGITLTGIVEPVRDAEGLVVYLGVSVRAARADGIDRTVRFAEPLEILHPSVPGVLALMSETAIENLTRNEEAFS